MAVYVDRLRDWGWRLGPSSHLLADTESDLHAFAARLGMPRVWAQRSRSGVVHYDLTARRRATALRLGAIDLADDGPRLASLLATLKAVG